MKPALFDQEPREPGPIAAAFDSLFRRLLRGFLMCFAVFFFEGIAVAVFLLWTAGQAAIEPILLFRGVAVAVAVGAAALIPEVVLFPLNVCLAIRQARREKLAELRRQEAIEERRRQVDDFLNRDSSRDFFGEGYTGKNHGNHGVKGRDFNGFSDSESRNHENHGVTGKPKNEAENPENGISESGDNGDSVMPTFENDIERRAYHLRKNGASWSQVCVEIYGAKNGQRVKELKNMLKKHGIE
jgi:hypothetical protein